MREERFGEKTAAKPTLLTANCSIWLFFLLNSFWTSLKTPLAPSRSPEAPWHTGKQQDGLYRTHSRSIQIAWSFVSMCQTHLLLSRHSSTVTNVTHSSAFRMTCTHLQNSSLSCYTNLSQWQNRQKKINPAPYCTCSASMSQLTWWENTYQSHRDTHAGSLFGLMQVLMHHGNRPKHCWYGTGDRGENTYTNR